MLDVTVKTLDGKNRNYSVPDDITVKQFKEKISASIEIGAENQRLIFIGRVLQDEKKLNDYDVNGKTIHMVERPPPGARSGATASSSSAANDSPRPQQPQQQGMHNILMGTFQLPSADGGGPNVQNFVQQALNNMGNIGRNATVATESSADGSSLDVHINLGQVHIPNAVSPAQRRITGARKMLSKARQLLTKLEARGTVSSGSSQVSEQATQTGSTDTASGSSTLDSATPPLETLPLPGEMGISSEGATMEAIAIVAETVEAEIEMETDNEELEEENEPTPPPRTDGAPPPTSSAQRPRFQPPQNPPVTAYADLFEEAFEVNRRLQCHLERFQRMMREEPTFTSQQSSEAREAQKFTNQVSSIIHYISHAYHNMSDLMVDIHESPPRQVRAIPVPMPFAMQQNIPMQAAMNVVHQTSGANSGTNTTAANSTTVTSSRSAAATVVTENNSTNNTNNTRPAQVTTASSTSSTSNAGTTTVTSSGQWRPPAPGTMIAGTGPPPFMQPDVFANMIRLAANAAVAAVPQHLAAAGVRAGQTSTTTATRPNGHTIVMRQTIPISAQVHVNTSSTPRPATAANPTSRPATSATAANPTSRPASTTANPVTTTQQQQQPRGVAMAIPTSLMSMAGGQPQALSGMAAVDPLLPCQSRHFRSRRTASHTPANGNGQQANPSENNPLNPLAGIMSQIVGGLVGQATPAQPNGQLQAQSGSQPNQQPAAGGTQPQPAVVNPFAALFGGNMRTPVPGTATTGAERPPQAQGAGFEQQLRNILAMGDQGRNTASTPTSTTTQPPTTATSQPAPTSNQAAPITDDMFTQLVSSIGQYMGQVNAGQEPGGNISDFLSSLGDSYVSAQGESLLSDIFNVVAGSINIMDLMQLFSGNSTSLQRTREPLQRYIRDTLLKDRDESQDRIETSIDRLLTDASPYLEQFCNDVTTVDNIDLESTCNTFLENHLRDLITFILNAREDDQDFHSGLYTRVTRMIHEAVILGENCLQGGFSAVTRLLHTRVGMIASDVNPLIRQWMSDVSTQQLTMLRPNITVRSADVQAYIIRHQPQAMEQDMSVSSEENEDFMSADEDSCSCVTDSPAEVLTNAEGAGVKPKRKLVTKSETVTMATPSSSSSTATEEQQPKVHIPRSAGDPIQPRVAPEGGSHPPRQTEGAPLLDQNGELQNVGNSNSAARARPQMTPMAYHTVRCAAPPTDDNVQADIRPGSEDWHEVVPSEWVSVITKDIERQKKQEKQKPHSDAYLSGNPAKKRKVSKYSTSEELNHPEQYIGDSVETAAGAVAAQPIHNTNTLTTELTNNPTLQQAFHQEVRNEVRKNLRNNQDLVPHKYKDAEKYFGNKQ